MNSPAISFAQWQRIGLQGVDVLSLWVAGDTVIAGSYQRDGGFYRSTDGGVSWLQATSNLHRKNSVNGIVAVDSFLFATCGYSTFDTCDGCGGVYRSGDNGRTWLRSNTGFPTNGIQVSEIININNQLLVGTDGGLFRSSNSAATWERVDSTLPFFMGQVLAFANHNGLLFAGTSNRGVFASSDCGVSWSAVSSGIPPIDSVLYPAVAPFIVFFNRIYAGVSSYGVYVRSSDTVWYSQNLGLLEQYVTSFTSKDRLLFASTLTKVHVLRLGDSTWRNFSDGIPFVERSSITSLARNSRYLFAGVAGFADGLWQRPLSDVVSVKDNETHNDEARGQLLSISQNYPNPFNANTSFNLFVAQESEFVLSVTDILGRKIKTFVGSRIPSGTHRLTWDGRNDVGVPLGSGMYFITVQHLGGTQVKKIVLIK